MNTVAVEVLVAALIATALALVVVALGGRSRHPNNADQGSTRKRVQPHQRKTQAGFDPMRKPAKNPQIVAALHPFAWDRRVVVALIIAASALLFHLWLYALVCLPIGYVLGETFFAGPLQLQIATLSDAMLFIARFRNLLGVGNTSAGASVMSALEALPASSPFRQEREEIYTQLTTMQIDPNDPDSDELGLGHNLVTPLLAGDTLMELRAIDELVFAALTNTQYQLADQLGTIADDLARRIRNMRELVETQLAPALTAQRAILVVSFVFSYFAIVAFGGEAAVAKDLGANMFISIVFSLTLALQTYLFLRSRLKIFTPTAFL